MTDHGSNINGQLRAFVERIERLDEEKAQITADIASVYAEAKSTGFDPKIIRKLIAYRKKDAAKRAEEEALLETYMGALGMLSDTPLGQAALKRDGVV